MGKPTSSGSVLAVICARGGSKGLPGKNLLPLAGMPMVAWSVRAGKCSKFLSRLIISTDDRAIADAAAAAGCEVPFLRPAEISDDRARIEDALIHALDNAGQPYEYIVLLQATSPFRAPEDIDTCIEICAQSGAYACVSVSAPAKSPYSMYRLDEEGRMSAILDNASQYYRRQEVPRIHQVNGAVYVARTDWFYEQRRFIGPETRAHIMPPERSVDIDTQLDYLFANTVIEAGLIPVPKE